MKEVILEGVKVVGKIDLYETDFKKLRFDALRKAYPHFNKRLLQRINVSISLWEYLSINKKVRFPKEKVFNLKIKNINVRAAHRGGVLVTALPLQIRKKTTLTP